jgi:excisionase family DNA binding protein
MPDDVSPLYVRLPRHEADLLDRAAFESKVSKRELVSSMVKRFLVEETPELVVGRAHVRPAEPQEVLTLDQAAALLQVDAEVVTELAEKGELPGRKLGDAWRFPRAALLEWLSAG